MRVAVLTTSYPRHKGDVAGAFVRDAVQHLRTAGVEIAVVSPAGFRDFGIAYGDGIAANLTSNPARAALLPAFFASYARAARRASRNADLVHAHWLPSGLPAVVTGKPFVIQAWGTDVELAARAPPLFRPLLRQARVVIAPSQAVADAVTRLGAADVRVIGSGVDLPETLAEPEDPPHALYVGRLAAEKGIAELARATEGIPRVVVGDGPLRRLVPDAVGFVSPAELGRYYERAAVVVCPSRREGYGVVAREAMAHGRPVVASAVGGLLDAVEHERTGLLVPPGDSAALRAAIERLLADSTLRARLGASARERAGERFSWTAATAATLAAYEAALSRARRRA
jgi:glycosyltransferase involved in cell wall biosynthesis